MKQLFKYLVAVCFCIVAVAAGADALGFVPETGVIADVVNFIIPAGGMMLGSAAAVAGPGEGNPGAAAVGDGDEEYFEEDLNKAIVKVRPSDTPLDTLTRTLKKAEKVESFDAGGWEIGTRETQDQTSEATTAAAITVALPVSNLDMWLANDTILVKDTTGADGKPLMLYVQSKGTSGSVLNVRAINGADGKVPIIADESRLFRLSDAHSEKDAQADPYNISPSNRKNYCQIHMKQVEETVIHGIQKKKVAMDFSVYKEQTVWDMKRGMEFTNLFGVKGKSVNAKGEPVYFSDGLWNQCENQSTWNMTRGMDDPFFVQLSREIFDGNNGSDTRFLFAGSGFLQALCSVDGYTKQLQAKETELVYGVKVHKISTSFGELLVKPMSSLFAGLHDNDALVIDINYVTKYVFEPLSTTPLDLDKSGQRRVNAVRLLENYCLYLENLPVHRRIVGVTE